MDVVIIFNGLGNQMSQYAFMLAKQKKNRTIPLFRVDNDCTHNGSELDVLFGVNYPKGLKKKILDFLYESVQMKRRKKLLNLLGVHFYKEPLNYDYVAEYTQRKHWGINFYWGGWHTEKYFVNMKDEIVSVFKFPEDNEPEFQKWVQCIKVANNSVSLHVRRGDYVNIPETSYYQFGGVATTEYYNRAIGEMKAKYPDCHFYVFSNDIAWCKENFGSNEFSYVDCNSGKKSWRDLYLMTLCKHHIIANSTFSWWGAWLSSQKDGVTLHPKWFIRDVETKDFYPETWKEI